MVGIVVGFPPRRTRAAAALVVLFALLASCTGGGSSTPPSPTETVPTGADVIGDFAAAWPDADVAGFRGIVDEPAVAAHDIAAHVEELLITDTEVTLTGDLDCGGDSCREHATVTHNLAGVGEWAYETLIKADLNQGQWLVQWSPATFHPDLTEVTTLVRHRTLPPRAPILDRNGVALTPERAIVRVGVVPAKVRKVTYENLGEILGIDTDALRDRVTAAEPDWFVPVIDLRKGDYQPLRDALLKVPGISIDTAQRALAPTSAWGRAVLGTVGPATAETLENAGPLALPTDEVGVSGLQFAFQQQLAGTPGVTIDLVEKATGDVLNHVLVRKPGQGKPLETSLDLASQNAAEQAVARATSTTAVVVVKASTGEVLAAANAPGPTSYNTAFVGHYAPGSTYKVVSAATLLKAGVVTPNTRVTCPDTTVVDGKQFKNYENGIAGPNPTFAQAFAASCNTTMVDRADQIGGKQLAAMAKQFGVGADWELGLDAFSGSAPADKDLVTRAADMIGQGKVEASPLMMAMVAGAVDSGVSRTPTLLPGTAPGLRLHELDPKVRDDLQKMMRLVVTSGTGQSVNLSGLPVYAKTGTAEFAKGKGTGTNAWMIGFRGDIAFAVLVEGGSSGAHDAAPVVNSLLAALPSSTYR
jgi:cell division protein FtsI/penicillin-binding protein 2